MKEKPNPTAQEIQVLRTQRGWSAEELARRLGMPGSGSIVADWEEGRRLVEGPLANLLLLTLRDSAQTGIAERAEQIWRRTIPWRESWRQVTAVPEPSNPIPAPLFSQLFPGAEIPAEQSAHGFPFVDRGLPPDVFRLEPDGWIGVIPAKDHPPAYLWRLERDGAFLYREKIWEDEKSSITAGHIHVGSILEICAASVFFVRRLAERIPLSSQYRFTVDLNGMKGRGVVAQREGIASDMLVVDSADEEAKDDRVRASLVADLKTISTAPLAVTYDLVAELLLGLRPDLANRAKLERHLRLRHASDDRRGGTRFLGFLDDLFDARPSRRAVVSLRGRRVGLLVETTWGTRFTYDRSYVTRSDARPISPTMPVRAEPYESAGLLSFFDNLLPEGEQLQILVRRRNLDQRDRFGLLLATLPSSVGDVQIHQEEKVETP